jgi:uncharacterized metal-binding protein YceD (DUF177 family)
MPDPGLALTHPLRVTRLSAKVPTTFDLAPDAASRAAVARELGIIAVEALTFRGTLTPVARHDFTLQADLSARVVQPCVVTLQPVATSLHDTVLRRFSRDYAEPKGDEVELQDDTIEPLPEVIDVGAVAVEALALVLPEYPRSRGAIFEGADLAPADRDTEVADRPKPFAGLADLAAKLALKASPDDEKS